MKNKVRSNQLVAEQIGHKNANECCEQLNQNHVVAHSRLDLERLHKIVARVDKQPKRSALHIKSTDTEIHSNKLENPLIAYETYI